MSGASPSSGRESEARAPTPRMTGLAHPIPSSLPTDPAALNSYLLGVAAAASYNPLLLRSSASGAATHPSAQLLQLAALQHWQAQSQLLPAALSAQLNPQALTALYYNQLLAASMPAASASPDPLPRPTHSSVTLSHPAPLQPTPPPSSSRLAHHHQQQQQQQQQQQAAGHPALTRVASEGMRRKSAPVIPVAVTSAVDLQQPSTSQLRSLSLVEEGAPSSHKPPVLSSPKAIQDHIDALISENDAIVTPQAPLLQKRRTYQRHAMEQQQGGKPGHGLASPPKKQSAGRSASLIESQLSPNLALQAQRQTHLAAYHRGSLPITAGMMISENPGPSCGSLVQGSPVISAAPSTSSFKCQHCRLDFTSEKALQAHVYRCSLNIAASASSARSDIPALVPASAPQPVREQQRQPLVGALSLDPSLLLQLHQQQILKAQAELIKANAAAVAAAASASPVQQPVQPPAVASPSNTLMAKSHHPLKKRILAEHALETTIAAAQAASHPAPIVPAKVPKLEPMEAMPQPSHSSDLRRPVAQKPRVSRVEASVKAGPALVAMHPMMAMAAAHPIVAAAAANPVVAAAVAAATAAGHSIPLNVALTPEEKARKFTPYTRTVEAESGGDKLELPRSGRRPRHVTAPTFVCMKRPQPFYLPATDPTRSMYASWQQVDVNPVEAKLNLLWMGGCCTRPRKGSHPFWKYTVATKELSVPRMTHSTFAQYSKKLKATQEAEAAQKAATEAPESTTPTRPTTGAASTAPAASSTSATTTTSSSSKERAWAAALEESATRRAARRASTKRNLSVDSNKSEESVDSGKLQIGSPMTSDTEDACEVDEEEERQALAARRQPPVPHLKPKHAEGRGVAKTPPMDGGSSVVAARLARDCQSVPAIPVSWPSPPPPAATTTSIPTAMLRSPVRNGATIPAAPTTVATSLSPFLVSNPSLDCTLCEKRFAKPDQLRLHMDIHIYQEGARKKSFTCTTCATAQPSKAALHKHITSAHPGEPLPAEATGKDEEGTTTSSSRSNPRPFKCTDCDTAFRGQGFLQKHLRSKLHVMKLECTGKLPFGTYALFEAANFNLAEIDTTDCESALASMRRHVAALQPDFQGQVDTKPPPIVKSQEMKAPEESSSSLVCTEGGPPATPPPPPAASKPAPSLVFEEARPEPDTPSKASSSSEASSSNNKSVIADVWIPPKEEDVAAVLPPPTTTAAPKQPPEQPKPISQAEETSPTSDESQQSFRDQSEPAATVISQPAPAPAPPKKLSEEGSEKVAPTQVHICHFCKLQTMSGTDLEVHLHADHIAMKDGNDFRCPRPNCDKIYPNRDSLRLHIAAHYLGGGTAHHTIYQTGDRDGDVSRETMAALQRKLGAGGAPGPASTVPPAGTVGNQSPGTPEESQTSFAAVTGGRKKMKTHLVALNSIPEAAPANGAGSPLSEAASDGSSPSPHPHHHHPHPGGGSGRKRKSVEDQMPSPLGAKRDQLSGRRCASALENNSGGGTTISAFAPSPLNLSSTPSYSLPAVPAHITQHAPLSWFGNGLLHSPFALLHHQQHQHANGETNEEGKRGEEKKTESTPRPGLQCPICQSVLPDVKGLQRHLVSHVSNRPFICSDCDAGFTTQAALQSHAATHSVPVKSE